MLDPNNPASTEKKSDTIRAELAKYRLLKKEALGINEEQPRDSKGSIKSSFVGIKSPTKPDLASQESLPAQYATYSTYTNKSKDDRQSSARKVHNLTTQSLRQHEESASTQSGGSDRNKVDTSLSQPSTAARELSNTLNYNPKAKIQSTLRSSATLPTGLKKTVPNKVIPGLSSDKKKDLTWSQIEEFVDMDIERDMLHKGPKTVKSDNKDLLRSSATFSKHSTAPLYSKENIEKRPSSSLEGSNKNAKELKTKTPNSVRYSEADEKKPKDQGSSSPEPYIVDDYKMRRTLPTSASDTRTKTQTRDSKDSKSLNQLLGRNISPRSALASIKADNESERGLREEVSKWRVFGKMMAESYDDLNRKYTSYLNEKGQDKKIIDVLKEQISTLKNLLKDSKEENVKLKEISSRNTKLNTLRSTDDDSETKEQSEFYQLSIELDNLKKENGEIMKMVEFLKDENEVMKKGIEEGNRFKDMAEKYQKLADSRFKECSALAEEIICLRTDLDRSHSNYLRIQREQSSGKKINPEAFNSGSKGSQGNEQKGVGANITGQSKYKRWNEQQQQQVSKWTEDLDEVPPLPSELSTLPSREETARIDK